MSPVSIYRIPDDILRLIFNEYLNLKEYIKLELKLMCKVFSSTINSDAKFVEFDNTKKDFVIFLFKLKPRFKSKYPYPCCLFLGEGNYYTDRSKCGIKHHIKIIGKGNEKKNYWKDKYISLSQSTN